MPRLSLVAALLVAAGTLAGADQVDDVGWTTDYAATLPHDALRIATAPARWDLRDWTGAALAVGAVGLAYHEDDRIARWSQRHRRGASDVVARVVKPFGREVVAVALVGFAVASPFTEDRRVARTALLGLESLVVAGVGYESLQLVAHRQRPSTGADRDDFAGLHGSGSSFPSGHTTAAFAFAGVLAHEWRDIPGAAPVAYGLATLVGLSRMNDNAHWASDVVAGAIIGWASAATVERLHPRHTDISVMPFSDGRSSGLAMEWRY